MQAVGSENEKHQEIGNHHGQVKSVDVVNTLKGGVGDFGPILADAGGVGG
jgi:hypothetical protein